MFETKPDQSKHELVIVNYLHYINRVDILSDDLSSNLIRHLDPEIAFKENLFLCPGNEALLIVSPAEKLVVGYEGSHSRFVYNTSFFGKSSIDDIFCLPNEGKMAVVFRQGEFPGPQTTKAAIYSSSFPTRATTRLMYVTKLSEEGETFRVIFNLDSDSQSLSFYSVTTSCKLSQSQLK